MRAAAARQFRSLPGEDSARLEYKVETRDGSRLLIKVYQDISPFDRKPYRVKTVLGRLVGKFPVEGTPGEVEAQAQQLLRAERQRHGRRVEFEIGRTRTQGATLHWHCYIYEPGKTKPHQEFERFKLSRSDGRPR